MFKPTSILINALIIKKSLKDEIHLVPYLQATHFMPVFHSPSVIPDTNWSHYISVSVLNRGSKTFIKKTRKIKNIPRRGAHTECETGCPSMAVEAAMNINHHSKNNKRFPVKLLLIER